VVISGDHNDPPHIAKWTNSADHKKAIENFKKPLSEHPLSLLIVKDMLLTGFDAPVCQVMYLDRKLTDHNLLQAIARVNRTAANKFCGYIVDYYGLTDYLADALKVFSSTDVQGALKNLKDEIPKLQAAHTRVKQHLRGQDLQDIDACIELLEDELKRQRFEMDFRTFAKQVEIVLPDPAANPFLADLKALGKVVIGCRNRYRDEQLNLVGCGEKVRKLIEEHVRATGVDPRVPPTKLFDVEFEQVVATQSNDRAKASEIEHAIKAHLKVKLDDDPEYYQSLALRLEEIIQKYQQKWQELVQQLLLFRDDMEEERTKKASELGLNETEFAFHGVLMAEIIKASGEESMDEETHQRVLDLTKDLVAKFQEATQIVGSFEKWDEVARIKKQIKRAILDQPFGDKALVDAVTDRFMDLGKRHFR
jgi:type I restriction enzyme R subunit